MKTIKMASEITGLTPKSIRDYERIGLIKPVERSGARYCLYTEDDINRLHQIKYYRSLKFSMNDISFLLNASQHDIKAAMVRQLRILDE